MPFMPMPFMPGPLRPFMQNILKHGALAFLPPDQVIDGWELVLAESDTLDIEICHK